MPKGYGYPGMKDMTGKVKQGDTSDVPPGNLYRTKLEKKVLAEPDQSQFADHSNSKPANRSLTWRFFTSKRFLINKEKAYAT